jgi:hypothetical protein
MRRAHLATAAGPAANQVAATSDRRSHRRDEERGRHGVERADGAARASTRSGSHNPQVMAKVTPRNTATVPRRAGAAIPAGGYALMRRVNSAPRGAASGRGRDNLPRRERSHGDQPTPGTCRYVLSRKTLVKSRISDDALFRAATQ